jgi:hypothetical protein
MCAATYLTLESEPKFFEATGVRSGGHSKHLAELAWLGGRPQERPSTSRASLARTYCSQGTCARRVTWLRAPMFVRPWRRRRVNQNEAPESKINPRSRRKQNPTLVMRYDSDFVEYKSLSAGQKKWPGLSPAISNAVAAFTNRNPVRRRACAPCEPDRHRRASHSDRKTSSQRTGRPCRARQC